MKNGRKRRRRKNADRGSDVENDAPSVSSEALRGVVAILCIAIAGFLVLAALNVGGTVGSTIFSWLSWVLGIGYLLLPLTLIILAIAVFRTLERTLNIIHIGSVVIFLLSGLGLISLAFPARGGVLGDAVSHPLVAAISTPATVVFLVAFLVASLVIAFDVNLGLLASRLREWFSSGESEDDGVAEATITGLPQEDAGEEAEQSEPDEEAAELRPAPQEKPAVKDFTQRADSAEGFPIIAATGSARSGRAHV